MVVIRISKWRMIGLPVGSWDDKVDPHREIKEAVGDCQTLLEDDALQPSLLSKKRKKIVEVLSPCPNKDMESRANLPSLVIKSGELRRLNYS